MSNIGKERARATSHGKRLAAHRIYLRRSNMKIEYSSNNSGGDWWLKDKEWKALEDAGWDVDWVKDNEFHKNCLDETGRWLGVLATSASKDFESVKDAVLEFERVTDQCVSDEGCNCCGPPHSFSWDGGYASGEDCLEYMYRHVPGSLRDAVELLNE
jgi:hypothetical protein